ncbi:MAG: ATP-binding protein [Chloroflexi bacterium]|nr:ATP-binding protein [Chloroflexota bacterium]
MYTRLLTPDKRNNVLLFGPRGTGKTTWVLHYYPEALKFDLLDSETYKEFLAKPNRLANYIPPGFKGQVIIDEIQRVPELLNEVHRLIESLKITFVLTGSSARKLRRKGHNLLAGRALSYHMHPLTAIEMKEDFSIEQALVRGMLPMAQQDNYEKYLQTYVQTYLEQEILQEGLTRNLSAFSRFMEVASLSQGQILNITNVAREAGIERSVVAGYFEILRDLLIGYSLPPFSKKAKRRLVSHPKFYYFDPGIYHAIRPKGPYDTPKEVSGISLETLVHQQINAVNELLDLGYKMYYFRTASGIEVDFILYGKKGIKAVEVKATDRFQDNMLAGLKKFRGDYPEAKLYLLYGGAKKMYVDDVTILPIQEALLTLDKWLEA